MSTIRTNSITNADGTGAPNFPNGLTSANSVGIGTTSPTAGYSLDVFGQAQIGDGGGNADINFNASNIGRFLVAGTERMSINTAGNVGIGTAAPATKLEIASAVMGDNFIRLNQDADPNTNFGVPVGRIQMRWLGDPNWASINFEDERAGAGGTHRSGISFTTRENNSAGVERSRFTSDGRFLIGKSGANISVTGWDLSSTGGSVVGTVSTGTNEIFTLNNTSTTGTAQVDFRTANVEKGSISWNNTSTAFNTSSDYRLKENVLPMQNALNTVAQLNPVTYTWKVDGSAGQGFIAHELQAVVPDCVTGEKDALDEEGNPKYQGVDTSFLVATLVKAIQELTARVATLEAEAT